MVKNIPLIWELTTAFDTIDYEPLFTKVSYNVKYS